MIPPIVANTISVIIAIINPGYDELIVHPSTSVFSQLWIVTWDIMNGIAIDKASNV